MVNKGVQLIFFVFALISFLKAQPVNDNCASPYIISNPNFWCSDENEFTTKGSTKDLINEPFCFAGAGGDVWFSFLAIGTDLNLSITSREIPLAGAIYSGECATLSLLACEKNNARGTLQLYTASLRPGKKYLIRIQAVGVNQGDFSICVNNYFPPALAGSDCASAFKLCSKDAFTIQSLEGFGNVSEMNDGACFMSPFQVESNSAWLKFTCKDPGYLTMNIVPVDPTDDIDFIIYRLNGDINSCDKSVVRCMATGQFSELCMNGGNCCGSTGLRIGETDISENSGCNDPFQNNYLRPLDLLPNESYAIAINNYSAQKNAVIIEFGGTATFQAVTPIFEFITDSVPVCLDQSITLKNVTDTTVFKIDNWRFFVTPEDANWQADTNNQIKFKQSGKKYFDLVVQDVNGCIVSYRDSIDIKCCGPLIFVDVDDTPFLEPGQIYTPQYHINTESEERSFYWSPIEFFDCADCPQPVITAPDESATFYLTVRDKEGCVVQDEFQVNVIKDHKIFVPNIFTPNNDGINDEFGPITNSNVERFDSFEIYDRWGACVYATKSDKNEILPWNGIFKGKKAHPGVYTWFAKVRFKDGSVIIRKGNVTLI